NDEILGPIGYSDFAILQVKDVRCNPHRATYQPLFNYGFRQFCQSDSSEPLLIPTLYSCSSNDEILGPIGYSDFAILQVKDVRCNRHRATYQPLFNYGFRQFCPSDSSEPLRITKLYSCCSNDEILGPIGYSEFGILQVKDVLC